MKHLLSLERLDVGRTLALTVGSPSAHRRGTTLKHVAFLLLFLFAGFGQVWATDPVKISGDYTAANNHTGWSQDGSQSSGYFQLGADGKYVQSPAFSTVATGSITVDMYAYVTGSSKSSQCSLIGLDKDGNTVETQNVTCSSSAMTNTYPKTTWTLNNSSNNIKQVKFVYKKATSSNMRVKTVDITYTPTGTNNPTV